MPLARRLLQPLLSRALVHPYVHQLLAARYELPRRLAAITPTITVWLRCNDPYSYLLVQVLPQLANQFELQFEIKLLPYQEPNHFLSHELRDAWYLAQLHQLSFHEFQTPNEESCQLANQILLAEHDLALEDYLTLIKQVFLCLWEHQSHKLRTLALRFSPFPLEQSQRRLLINQHQLTQFGQDKAAYLHYQGHWFWCLDDLLFLTEQLSAAGLGQEYQSGLYLPSHTPDYLINDTEQLTIIRRQKYQLDYYFHLNEPWSYLYFQPVCRLAEYYQLKLHLKPILLSQYDDCSLDLSWYQRLQTLTWFAQKTQTDFGRICLANDKAMMYSLNLICLAKSQGLDQAVSLAVLQRIWATGHDLSYSSSLKQLIKETGLKLKQINTIKNDSYLSTIEQYTLEWTQLDVPYVPTLYLHGERRIAFGGAHRLWAIEMALIDNMKLIGTI
ncbi:DsbA family protein [Agitococcus lubricus]|uniref:2-hydroxychromene-2-carboxylate isomerase n=1 Tax=Agitococcus lubricus TaxID=1077255 RepID=A0A2T5J3R2_9GAMM|nr:DsbA family protein [Agitococcus lubricus]PTQ91188.1 2-hydroxychromene-2-carboxylate isomerase [Agitococcus lubricus]